MISPLSSQAYPVQLLLDLSHSPYRSLLQPRTPHAATFPKGLLGGDPRPPPALPDLASHDWRPARGVSIMQPLVLSKAQRSQDLTLIFHNQDGMVMVFSAWPAWLGSECLGGAKRPPPQLLKPHVCTPPPAQTDKAKARSTETHTPEKCGTSYRRPRWFCCRHRLARTCWSSVS